MVSPLRDAAMEQKAERHQERDERRREMEFVPKARYEDCGEERDDDL